MLQWKLDAYKWKQDSTRAINSWQGEWTKKCLKIQVYPSENHFGSWNFEMFKIFGDRSVDNECGPNQTPNMSLKSLETVISEVRLHSQWTYSWLVYPKA